MIGAGDEPARAALGLNLDQGTAQLAQKRAPHRLVVDERPAAPVGADHPAQHQLALDLDAARVEKRAQGVAGVERERRRDARALGPGTHQPGVAARADDEPERVEQDRLAGAGLAGQREKPRAEGEIEPVYQDDVANGQADQHRGPRRSPGRMNSKSRRTGAICLS